MGRGRNNDKPNSIANMGRSNAVSKRPDFLNKGREKESSNAPIANRGRSNAVTGSASDHFRQVGFAKTDAEKTLSSSSREKIHQAMEKGLQKIHTKSQARDEKTHALAYKQANNSNSLEKAVNTAKGYLTPNVDTKQANRIAEKIDSGITGRIQQSNEKAYQHETNAGRLSKAATAASATGTIANAAAGLTGGASLAVSAGASLASAGLNEAAARQAGKASNEYGKNANTDGKQGLNLLDAYISREKSGEQDIEKKKHRVAAAMGIVSGATGASLDLAGVSGKQVFETGGKDLFSTGTVRNKTIDLSSTKGVMESSGEIKRQTTFSAKLQNGKNKAASFLNKALRKGNTVGTVNTLGSFAADKAAAATTDHFARSNTTASAKSDEKSTIRQHQSEIAKTQVKQGQLSRGLASPKLKESDSISNLSASAKRIEQARKTPNKK